MPKLKTLVIVESPTKATKIQEYLGSDFIVMSSKGHITDLAKGGKFNLGIDLNNDFKTKYVLLEDKVSTLDSLMAAAKKCDLILLAGDPDREGTAICWHLRERLKDLGKPMKRMIFNEIKKDKLLKAVKDAGDIDMNLFQSQEARRVLDRIVGFMASPFLMNNFGPKLSAGRVQSVLTRLVVDREKEIDVFLPEDYWTLNVELSKDNATSFTTKYAGRPTDLSTAQSVYDILKNNNEYIISEVLSDEEKVSPPPPMITSSLQRFMSKTYNMSSDRTMKAAQSLYENGYCTYIRTDSTRASDEAIKELKKYLEENGYPVFKKVNVFKNKNSAQDAHECIRPSDLLLTPNDIRVGSDEKQVYETIWKFFVASQMAPAVFDTLKITAKVKNHPECEVKSSGKALKQEGFLKILGTNHNYQIDIPPLKNGDVCFLFGKNPVKMEKKQTQPPPRYSEDKLIKELETKGIGRPATYSALLGTITSRQYVEKKGNVYYPTELGKKITNVLADYFTFMNYDYTSKLEDQLDEIEHGKINKIDMLNLFYKNFKLELDKAYSNYGGDENKTKCDKCNSVMLIKTNKKDGTKFLACSGFPNCKSTKPIKIVVRN